LKGREAIVVKGGVAKERKEGKKAGWCHERGTHETERLGRFGGAGRIQRKKKRERKLRARRAFRPWLASGKGEGDVAVSRRKIQEKRDLVAARSERGSTR